MGRDSRNKGQGGGTARPSRGVPGSLLVGGAVLLALGAFNAWSLYSLRKDDGERSKNLDARMAKVETRLDAMAKAQQAQQPRRGPDPDKVYTVRYDGAPARGITGAPIVIAEFSDFQ